MRALIKSLFSCINLKIANWISGRDNWKCAKYICLCVPKLKDNYIAHTNTSFARTDLFYCAMSYLKDAIK